MPVPPLPAGQRAAAVTKSAETRRARAEMLHALASGQASLADVLARTDDVARRTRVTQVLKALPGYGPGSAGWARASAPPYSPLPPTQGDGREPRTIPVALQQSNLRSPLHRREPATAHPP